MTSTRAGGQSETDRKPLRVIMIARLLLVVVAASHLVIPIIMLLRRASLEQEIARLHPDLSALDVSHSASIAVYSALASHAALLVLSVVLIVRLPTLSSVILRLTIISQLAGVAFSFVSWSSSTMFHAVIPVLDVVQLVIAGCGIAVWPLRRRSAQTDGEAQRTR